MGFAIFDDVFRGATVDAGHVFQQRLGCGVQVHADVVDRGLHHPVQRFGQAGLVDVVLVEPHPDGFRVDLHQLGQGVQQAASDGDVTAHFRGQVRELLFGQG